MTIARNAMSIENQEQRYQVLLEEAEGAGNIESGEDKPGGESHPRFKIEGTEMQIDIRLKVSVIDISRSCVSFLSNIRFNIGQRYDFKVGSVFSIQAEVMKCEMVETDAGLMEMQFRVESDFIEQELGLHSLLSIIDR